MNARQMAAMAEATRMTRQGRPVGYAYVRLVAGTLEHPAACQVGPIGVREVQDAAACLWAAVAWAHRHASVLHLDVPGAHATLPALLDAGFRIVYVETFLSTAEAPFTDPRRYVGSGGSLF